MCQECTTIFQDSLNNSVLNSSAPYLSFPESSPTVLNKLGNLLGLLI